MSYRRVLPRDLFNEADLLKCLGRLVILVEGLSHAGFDEEDVDGPFVIKQNPFDGSLEVTNLTFRISGEHFFLHRPLNSREPWPLFLNSASDPDFEEIRVFDPSGRLSTEMRSLLR